jgi:hypothetical protein
MNFQKCSNDVRKLIDQIRCNPTPASPEFSTFSSRLKTFKTFPSNSTQNKYKLAECGFKYLNLDDAVECHWCGVILFNFENFDCPYIEHTRHSPNCFFILITKGSQYIQKVLAKYCKTEVICNCETGSYDTIC